MSNADQKHWRRAAFIVRCAQRYSSKYVDDSAEPASARAAVKDALALAEARVIAGGASDDHDDGVWMVDGAYFDSYDVAALLSALSAFDDAAENTYAELHEDRQIESSTRRIWTAIRLAGLALHTAMHVGPGSDIDDLLHQAVAWTTDLEPALEGAVGADLIRAMTSDAMIGDGFDAIFGDLWPEPRPAGW